MSSCTRLPGLILAAFVLASGARAQAPAPPKPTEADVAYGPHPRQVLDFYQAQTPAAAPLLFFIHGGGWMVGDKARPDFLAQCLENGISVVSINYRLIPDATEQKVWPPVKACLDDAARALQFVRSKSREWRIDPRRIGACGGSAGGFTALWLAFHPEMARADSPDPIARESTRVRCVLAFVPQTTLDPEQMRKWIPNNQYGNHAFGLPSMQAFLDQRKELWPWIERFSPYSLASADDPPVLLFFDNPPNLGQPHKDPPHSANFGAGLAEKLKALGVEHEVNYNNPAARVKYPNLFQFLQEKLSLNPR